MQQTFDQIITKRLDLLELYTKAITRAHGANHPETYAVRELFESIRAKVLDQDESKSRLDLDTEFTQLRTITDSYTIPGDVCETYAATYTMLSEVDEAYQANY